jgi:hypothetical protein
MLTQYKRAGPPAGTDLFIVGKQREPLLMAMFPWLAALGLFHAPRPGIWNRSSGSQAARSAITRSQLAGLNDFASRRG